MNNPLVTVIVPVYKAENYIIRCAKSLLGQTYDNIEYYFVNDCTPDRSVELLEEVVKEYPEREKYVNIVNLDSNKGHAHARNVALKKASGKYVIQIDADDWVENDMIEVLVQIAETQESDITCCSFYWEGKEQTYFKVDSQNVGKEGLKNYKILLENSAHWNKLIKLNLIRDNEVYCIEGTNNWVDVGQIIPLRVLACKISATDKPLYHYNVGNVNSVSRKLTPKRIADMLKVTDHVTSFVESKSNGEYSLSMNYLKFYAKWALIAGENSEYKEWRNKYPESNKHLFKYPLPLSRKILFLCALLHMNFIYELAKKLSA